VDKCEDVNNERPVTLAGIAFCTMRGIPVVTESEIISFCDYEHMEKYIQSRKKYWSELFGEDLTISADSHQTLNKVQVIDILKLVCKKLGVDYNKTMTKYKGADVVEARRITMAICHKRHLPKRTIGKALRTDHTNTIYHINKNRDYCQIDKSYRKKFLDIEDSVLMEIGGMYSEDGSGKKINANENAKIHRD